MAAGSCTCEMRSEKREERGREEASESRMDAANSGAAATPRNRKVPPGSRRAKGAREKIFLLSAFKSMIDPSLLIALIEPPNLRLRFTLNAIDSQQKSAFTIDECSISFTRNSLLHSRMVRHSDALASTLNHSQLSAPPDWYSMTRVSKKLRSFFRSIISLIQGNGLSSCRNIGSRPICCARRLAM